MRQQQFELVEVATLQTHPDNPRQGDVGAISVSIETNGFFGALVVQKSTRRILAGNHRYIAAVAKGMPKVPVLWIDCDDEQARRILLADNRTNDLATYDENVLAHLLTDLAQTQGGLAGTGYDGDDLDDLLRDLGASRTQVESNALPIPDNPVTQVGDVWTLGPHRLICGDCRDPEVVRALVEDRKVNVAFTSPPYADRRPYDERSGFQPIPPDEYVQWFAPVAANVASVLADDGSWFVNIKAASNGLDTETYVMDLVLTHAREWGWHFATEFCWQRSGTPQRVWRRFKNQFEPVYQFARGEWKMRPDAVKVRSEGAITPADVPDAASGAVERVQGTGVLRFEHRAGPGLAYPGNRLPTFANSEAVSHGATFPVGLPAWFAKAFSDEGDVMLDPFCRSGSTLLAAHETQRNGLGVELSPAYCDVALARFQRATGIVPERNGEAIDFSTT